jgi:hypothetical protein
MNYYNDGKMNKKFNNDELVDLENGKKRNITGKKMLANG